MPKNRKKNSGNGVSAFDNGINSDDEFSNDNASVYSNISETGNSVSNDEKEDAEHSTEKYEEKIMQAMENATEKSAQTRTQALQTLCELLQHHYLPDFIDDRKVTITDIIERSVRRGKGSEQSWAARLGPILIMQLGGEEEITKALRQSLMVTMQDTSVPFDARAKCATALGLLYFLGGDDIGEVISLMQTFETQFSGSYLKGDKTPSSASADAGILHSAALSAWCLLLTLIPPGDLVSLLNSHQNTLPSIKTIMGMLKSPNLDVRMAAGEAIAVVLESGRAHDDEFCEEYLPELIEATKQLATDSQKFRAKRDRKTQRATFRDVLHYLEEDQSPEISIRFGKESLLLDTWAIHHQYNSMCAAMGSGMSIQLAENELIRDILHLGAKLDTNGPTQKMTKAEKRHINAVAFKARTITRGKNRDKRSAVVN